MNILFTLCFLCVSFAAASPCPTRPKIQPIPNITTNAFIQQALYEVDQLITNAVSQFPLPGIVATIVYDQEQIWAKGYGKRDFFNPQSGPPSTSDLVRIASITKVFTDVMLFQARDAGLVNLDDYVSKYIPNFRPKNPYGTKRQITLRQLASHSSGLERETPCNSSCNQAQVITNANNRWVVLPQYNRPHYSNFGVSLLGRALEVPVKQKYEDYITQRILQPLSMEKATFTYNATTQANLAVGVSFGSGGKWVKAPIHDLAWENPDGGLFASADDLAKLMVLFFSQNETAGGKQILDGSTVAEMFTPVLLTKDGIGGFGVPFELNYTQKYWTYSKAGELSGYRSNLAMVPELKLGIFISALISDTPDDTTLTIPALEMLIPAFERALFAIEKPPPLPPNLSFFVGTYKSQDDSEVTAIIQVTNQQLTLQMRDGNDEFFSCLLYGVEFDDSVLLTVYFTPLPECRWVDDGQDTELIYFFGKFSASGTPDFDFRDPVPFASGLIFMETTYQRIS